MLEKTFAEPVLQGKGRQFKGKVASNVRQEKDGGKEQPIPGRRRYSSPPGLQS